MKIHLSEQREQLILSLLQRNLRRLGQKLDAMPTAAIADGLSNRDHDKMQRRIVVDFKFN